MPAEMIEMKAAPYVMALFGLVLIVLGIREDSMDIGQILIALPRQTSSPSRGT